MKQMLLAGLDIGTTGCKISVLQPQGSYLGSVYRQYPTQRMQNTHEIDAKAIWQAVLETIEEAARRYPGIGGIGVTSFGETFVLLDEQDQPLCMSMLYTDPRGEECCARLTERLGEDFIIRTTNLKPHAMYSLPKIMWLRENCPATFRKVRHIFLMQDYIVYMLTGRAQIDYSLATRSMAFDLHSLTWSRELLDAAEIAPELLSHPVPTGTSAGTLRPGIVSRLGLDARCEIVSISHDQVAAAIGSGVFDQSATVDGAGTVECMVPVFTTCDTLKMAENNYCVVPFLMTETYVTYAFSYTGGALVRWFADNLAGYAAQQAKNKGTDLYAELEVGGDGTPTGILVLPHFAGAATPYMDAGSKGAMVGLSLSHTQQDLYRAIMEGVCYEMRLNQECLASCGVRITSLRATGGGAKSRVWLQMKADVLGVPVTPLETNEAGATGSAMMVGLATHVYASLEEAARLMVRPKATIFPCEKRREQYNEIYHRYKQLYAAVRPLV